MSVRRCRQCGEQVSTDTWACPSCGRHLPAENRGQLLILLLVLVLLGLLGRYLA